MWTAATISMLHRRRRAMAGPVALVPTMGCLHAGHRSLIERALAVTGDVIVSIFVNPIQFGSSADLATYPRAPEADLAVCREAGVRGVFAPSVDEVYPVGAPAAAIDVPQLTTMLEGALRPGHFAGVCRVVLKLFNLARPDLTCFGLKDYQQLRVVAALIADLNLPIELVACPTVRDPDGLALSSRNRHLDPGRRGGALGLYRALVAARRLVIDDGASNPRRVEEAMRQVLLEHEVAVDYAALRHPRTLAELDRIEPSTGGVVGLVAGRVGGVRLIDNMVIGGR